MSHSWWIVVALACGALLASSGGCQRTPPTPHRVKGTPPQADDSLLVAHERVGATIRDDDVAPATLEVEVAAPIPKSEQQLAADALTRIGPPAVPMLVEALQRGDLETRRQACEVLMRMGPDAKDAVPQLTALLDDPDEELRRMAATALGRIGPDAGGAVPALMRQMLEGESALPASSEPRRLPR